MCQCSADLRNGNFGCFCKGFSVSISTIYLGELEPDRL